MPQMRHDPFARHGSIAIDVAREEKRGIDPKTGDAGTQTPWNARHERGVQQA